MSSTPLAIITAGRTETPRSNDTASVSSSAVEQKDGIQKGASLPSGKTFVASKNGTAFYLPDCSGAKRIKEENKIWFATKEEAVGMGYKPAATCKGLQ